MDKNEMTKQAITLLMELNLDINKESIDIVTRQFEWVAEKTRNVQPNA